MIGALTRTCAHLAKNYLPDAYIFALVLTFVVFLAGIFFQGATPLEMISFWGGGFWDLMNFAMQMALVLITGFTLAKTALVKRLLKLVAGLAKTNVQAVLIVTLVSCAASYLNWGFGLICSALLALELARKVRHVNYGLLIASAYSGFLVWHGGLSGSIPLKLTDPQDPVKELIGSAGIGLEQTLYSTLNLSLLGATVAALLLINFLMARDKTHVREVFLEPAPEKAWEENKAVAWADKMENSWILNLAGALFFLIYIVDFFFKGGDLGLNMVIFIFLALGVLLHFRPKSFLKAFNESVEGSSGILLQFPFYAGIMGMMGSSGLAESLSQFFISISTENTFLFFSYLSAGIVNFFVPSGGGQWAIQGPIILPAAQAMGVDFSKAAMAIAWGDAWTNMIQPFWALPLLAAGRCDLREMMGYSAVIFLAVGLVHSSVFLFF